MLTVELDEPAPVLEVSLDFEFVSAAFSLQTCMPPLEGALHIHGLGALLVGDAYPTG